MTRKLMAPTVVVALIASLVPATSASAQTLSFDRATRLAKRLAMRQVGSRDIVAYHISRPRRVSRRTVLFLYDDRSRDNQFCTGRIVVRRFERRRGHVVRARFIGARCRRIPSEALRFEALTREAVRAVRARQGDLAASLGAWEEGVEDCENLRVPRNRGADATLITSASFASAAYDPIDAELERFVVGLEGVPSDDPVLVAATASWRDWLSIIRALPELPSGGCPALRQWAANGWTPETAPVDLPALRASDDQVAIEERVLLRASQRLVSVGVFPQTAVQFTPDGLLASILSGRARSEEARKPLAGG